MNIAEQQAILECPWCQHQWPTDLSPGDYEFCPGCHGSFSFATPVPAPEAERRREKRAAIDRMARFCGMLPAVYLGWDPFTDPAAEREVLTAAQERWGQASYSDDDPETTQCWEAFMHHITSASAPCDFEKGWSRLWTFLASVQPGDIARAVDTVLRQYPEIA